MKLNISFCIQKNILLTLHQFHLFDYFFCSSSAQGGVIASFESTFVKHKRLNKWQNS